MQILFNFPHVVTANFRVFNPITQQLKFDPNKEYVRKWVENVDKPDYPKPMIDHDLARKRVIEAYKSV